MSETPPPDPDPGVEPDPATVAIVRALMAIHRQAGVPDPESRRMILDELRTALPEPAFAGHDWEPVIAEWQRTGDFTEATAASRKRHPPVRLWPLLFLPILGVVVAILLVKSRVLESMAPIGIDDFTAIAFGLIAGCGLMILAALGVIVARLGVRQISLRAILIAVAASAILLGMIRACVR